MVYRSTRDLGGCTLWAPVQRSRARLALLGLVVGLFAALLVPTAASAAAPSPPSLNGESFNASPQVSNPPYPFFLVCGNGFTSGPNFSFDGTASGPYPGTFIESGTIDYNPTLVNYQYPFGEGPVTGFSTAFTIVSPNGVVTGSETLIPTDAPAVCWESAGGGGVDIGWCDGLNQSIPCPIKTEYTVTVVTSTGTYQDHGTSSVTLNELIGLGQYWFAGLTDAFKSAPASIDPPTVTGTPTQGQTLVESHGNWTGSPTSYSYQWSRCDSTGNNCTPITGATNQTYKLTAAEAGSTVRVQESATNPYGTSGPATSAQTAVVLPLPPANTSPPPPPTSPPANTSPPPQPTSPPVSLGGSTRPVSVVQAIPSPAQIKAQLLKQLAPTGKAAKIAALLKRDGYTSFIKTLSAGRVVINWYYLPTGADVNKPNRKPKPVLFATGKASFSKAALVKTTIKLTANGKRMLKATKSVKLTAAGTYTPTGKPTVTVTKRFTLRR